jgi:hypothetical protein
MRKDGEVLERGVFGFGGKKEAAGVRRGCCESIEIQSELACNQLFSKKTTIANETHSASPYAPSMAQPSVCGFLLAGHLPETGRSSGTDESKSGQGETLGYKNEFQSAPWGGAAIELAVTRQ